MKAIIFFASLTLLFTVASLEGQEHFRVDKENSIITVEGTSSVHDWEMKASEMNVEMKEAIGNETIKDILAIDFSVPSKKLVSENNIMNKKTWDALKADKHQHIEFALNAVDEFSSGKNKIAGTASGTLSIAGVQKKVSIPFSGLMDNEGALIIEGQEKINMYDYNIAPPTAMLGALKTGELVTVRFKFSFIQDLAYTKLISNQL
ncbi:MAG: YceI family protein [Bacteroidales bacterium]|nr:YceI family protein [Bacteroidales bacterium]